MGKRNSGSISCHPSAADNNDDDDDDGKLQ